MCLAPYPDLTMRLMGDFEAYNGPVLPPEIIGQWLFDFEMARRHYTGNSGMLYAGLHSFANPITVKGHNFDYLFTSQPRYNRPGVTPPLNVRQWAGSPTTGSPADPEPHHRRLGIVAVLSSDGNAQAYGCPDDEDRRIDCNIVQLTNYPSMLLPKLAPPEPEPPVIIPNTNPVTPPDGEDDDPLHQHATATAPCGSVTA